MAERAAIQWVAPIKAVAPERRAVKLLPLEDEDSLITGMTRSLHRRLLGLNLPQYQIQAVTLSLAPRPVEAHSAAALQPRSA